METDPTYHLAPSLSDVVTRLDTIIEQQQTLIDALVRKVSGGSHQAAPRPQEDAAVLKELVRRGEQDFIPWQLQRPPTSTHDRIIRGVSNGKAPRYRTAWFYIRGLLEDGRWRLAEDLVKVYFDIMDDAEESIAGSSVYGLLTAASYYGLLERNVPPLAPGRGRPARSKQPPLAYRLGTPIASYPFAVRLAEVGLDDPWAQEGDVTWTLRKVPDLAASLSPTYRAYWLGELGEDGEVLADQ